MVAWLEHDRRCVSDSDARQPLVARAIACAISFILMTVNKRMILDWHTHSRPSQLDRWIQTELNRIVYRKRQKENLPPRMSSTGRRRPDNDIVFDRRCGCADWRNRTKPDLMSLMVYYNSHMDEVAIQVIICPFALNSIHSHRLFSF